MAATDSYDPTEDPFTQEVPLYLVGTDQSPRSETATAVVQMPSFLDADWEEVEVTIEPSILHVAGGRPLMYPGHSHCIAGRGGSGKTWICAHCVVEFIRNNPGSIAVYVDYEDTRATFKARMKSLGVSKAEAGRIAYWKVSASLLEGSPVGKRWLAWVDEHRPGLVILDSVAKCCAAAGLNDELNPDFHRWDNGVIVPLTNRGITTIRIDHTGHGGLGSSSGDRERGASGKKDAVSGASYLWKVKEHWTRYSDGYGELVCLKSRHGAHKEATVVAEVRVTVMDEGANVRMSLTAPVLTSAGSIRKTWYMEQVSKFLERTEGPASQSAIERAKIGKTQCVRDAIAALVGEGYVNRQQQGQSMLHTSIRPYRQDDDPMAEGKLARAPQPARSPWGGSPF